jgi:hypothetical protein
LSDRGLAGFPRQGQGGGLLRFVLHALAQGSQFVLEAFQRGFRLEKLALLELAFQLGQFGASDLEAV